MKKCVQFEELQRLRVAQERHAIITQEYKQKEEPKKRNFEQECKQLATLAQNIKPEPKPKVVLKPKPKSKPKPKKPQPVKIEKKPKPIVTKGLSTDARMANLSQRLNAIRETTTTTASITKEKRVGKYQESEVQNAFSGLFRTMHQNYEE